MTPDLSQKAIIFNIQRFSLHDGPGIRTLVFFKGCPLHCQWCDNPESQNPQPELGFLKELCNKCEKCAPVCPAQAITLVDEMPRIDRKKCTVCGKCLEVCTPEALNIYGKSYSVEEVFQAVKRDKLLYGDDGGVTVSGGGALMWASFVVSLFELCRQSGITTAIETEGFAKAEILKVVLAVTDFVMYDLKHLDAGEHRKLTGMSNNLILENARLVVMSNAKVQFRMPLIPGVNDCLNNIRMTAEFIRGLQKEAASIELMPYHLLGASKYEALDRVYPLAGVKRAEPEQIESVRKAFEEFGVRCLVSH